jgi:hypothetical protein
MEMLTQTVENQEVNNEQISQHEQEMIAKVDAAEAKALEKDADQFGNESESEELIDGKFKSQEDLLKAYKELESKLGAPKEEPKDEVKEDTPATQEEAEKVAESKGVDFDSLSKEFAENGSLSEDTYKNLMDKGISKDVVDTYIQGQQAMADAAIARLQTLAGGEESYNSMIEWARDTLSESEKAAFNRTISNKDTAEFAIQGLYARYKAAAEPNLIGNGVSISNSSGNSYASQREMMADMASPKYRNDPAFRKQVEQKIARSKF